MRETYGTAIRQAFEYVLQTYPEAFVIGQGLWSPWYVGNSMTDLDKQFGIDRIIDTPVAESACTGAAVGAALAGMKPIVVHPRMDFALYAMDALVNQAAKWSHMTGGQAHPSLTVRAIINRGVSRAHNILKPFILGSRTYPACSGHANNSPRCARPADRSRCLARPGGVCR